MKIAIIGDTHLETRGGSASFRKFSHLYIKQIFDECEKRGIRHAVHLGDVFDTRKGVSTVGARHAQNLMKYAVNKGIELSIICGNHDIAMREDNKYNSINTVFDALVVGELINLYDTQPKEAMFDSVKVLFVPWINKNNRGVMLSAIQNSDADICFGHFELTGFPMYRGIPSLKGDDPHLFKKFKKVFSGHYHTRSTNMNIEYVGSPYHLNWSDYKDGTNRGWMILDTETLETEFIQNTDQDTMFKVIEYDFSLYADDAKLKKSIIDKDKWKSEIEGKIIKVVVKDKTNASHYKKFTSCLAEIDTIDISYIDETIKKLEDVEIDEEKLQTDTIGTIQETIEAQTDIDVDKAQLVNLMVEIYEEAVQIREIN